MFWLNDDAVENAEVKVVTLLTFQLFILFTVVNEVQVLNALVKLVTPDKLSVSVTPVNIKLVHPKK